MIKLGLVALLLVAASRARGFVQRRLPGLAVTTTLDLASLEAPAELPVPVG